MNEPVPFEEVLPVYGQADIRDLLHNLSQLHNLTSYEMVRRGHRLADVYHVHPRDFDTKLDRVAQDRLVFLPISRVAAYDGFSHKHEFVTELNEGAMVYGVVSSDLDTATAFKEAHFGDRVDHEAIGHMLGYPDCCCKSFNEYWGKSCDPIYEIAENTAGCKVDDNKITITSGNPRLYSHLRYFGLRVIPWFPCSYECEESIELSGRWLSVMRDINPELTDKVLELMSMPSSWDLLNAQVLVKHPLFRGIATSYYTEDHKIVMFE
ncbi:DUF483 domain-containing protein [bacterium]|nr:MAG: DUF483 domain-containing protein [bacterium]